MALNNGVDGLSSQLDPTIWIGLLVGLFMVFSCSMVTSLACWCSFRFQTIVSSQFATIPLTLPFTSDGAEPTGGKSSPSYINIARTIEQLCKTHWWYPEPEIKKKKRRSKRKCKKKNGWRVKRKSIRKCDRKRKFARQFVLENCNRQPLNFRQHDDYLIDSNNTQPKNHIQPSNKPKPRPKQPCLVKLLLSKKAVPVSRSTLQMGQCDMLGSSTPRCPPKLKGRRKTLKLLHCAKHKIKQRTSTQSHYHHVQQLYTSTSDCLEEFLLKLPIQDTDNQNYEYIHSTGLSYIVR